MTQTTTRVEPAKPAGAARRSAAFYREAGRPKAIWEVPEAGHVGTQDARPREYEERVTRFFNRALTEEQR